MACSSCGRAAATRAGNSVNNAIVFGDPTNEVFRVRVTGNAAGLQKGAIKYVRGTGVTELVDAGEISVLAGGARTVTGSGPTLYYVGNVGYSTMEAARVRSGQTGEEIVVRSFGG